MAGVAMVLAPSPCSRWLPRPRWSSGRRMGRPAALRPAFAFAVGARARHPRPPLGQPRRRRRRAHRVLSPARSLERCAPARSASGAVAVVLVTGLQAAGRHGRAARRGVVGGRGPGVRIAVQPSAGVRTQRPSHPGRRAQRGTHRRRAHRRRCGSVVVTALPSRWPASGSGRHGHCSSGSSSSWPQSSPWCPGAYSASAGSPATCSAGGGRGVVRAVGAGCLNGVTASMCRRGRPTCAASGCPERQPPAAHRSTGW